jgi:hypothetical protein
MQDNAARFTNTFNAARQEPDYLKRQGKIYGSAAQYVGQQAGRVLNLPVAAAGPTIGAILSPVARVAAPAVQAAAQTPLGRAAGSTIGNIGKWYGQQSPDTKENLSAIGSASQYLPLPAVKPVLKAPARGIADAIKPAATKLSGAADNVAGLVENQRGSVKMGPKKIEDVKAADIADIEAVESGAAPEPPSTPEMPTGKTIRGLAADKPKKPWRSGIKNEDATALSAPEDGEVIPFAELAATQAKMMANRGTTPLPSAMDKAGSLAVKAWKEIQGMRRKVGQQYESALNAAQREAFDSGVLFQGEPVRNEWAGIVGKYFNADITPEGKIVSRFGEGENITAADIRKLEQITKAIDQTGDAVFPKEYVSLSQKINAIIKQSSANLPINSRVQGAGKEFAHFVDKNMEEVLGPEFAEASQKYRKLRTLETALSKRLGDVVDPDKEIARHGASLLKSAVMSNADRGGKVMFDEIKNLTGIDLYRTANYAKIAMEATGDSRIFDLLKTTGELSGVVPGGSLAGAAAKVGLNKVKQKYDEGLLARMVDYYNKSQGQAQRKTSAPVAKPTAPNIGSGKPLYKEPSKSIGDILGNQRGSVGNPQTKTENFKKWFGESKAVDNDGNPVIMYHGSDAERDVIEPGYDEPGAWFTSNVNTAGNYLKGSLEGNGHIESVYLSAKNPLVADSDIVGGEMIVDGIPFDNNVDIVKYAQKKGYDSVHFPKGNFSEDSNTWVVFKSNQIKSASGNNGAFDPKNPDIRGSIGGTDVMAGIASLGAIGGAGYAATRKKAQK